MVSAEFRKKYKDGYIVWIRAQAKWIGEEEGYPLLHCVFQNISDLKAAQFEMNHLVNSIPGGIASYHIEKERFISTYFSDGVAERSGHTRSEMEEMVREAAFHIIYEGDRERVADKVKEALISGVSARCDSRSTVQEREGETGGVFPDRGKIHARRCCCHTL